MWVSVEVVIGVRIVQCHAIMNVVIGVRVMLCHATKTIHYHKFPTSCPNSHLVVRLYQFIITYPCSNFVHTFARDIYTARRLQQTAVSCKRSICNKVHEFKKIMP